MPKKKLSALEARKQLLVAESDLNRVLLTQEYHAVQESLHEATEPYKNLASSVSVAFDFFKGFRASGKNGSPNGFFWPGRLLKWGLDLWSQFRHKKDPAEAKDEFVG